MVNELNKTQFLCCVSEVVSLNRHFYRQAAILNSFDLRSIIGCPGGMSTFRLYFRALFGTFFLKFSQNTIVLGKRSLCRVGCNNDRLFLVQYQKYGLSLYISREKRRSLLHPNTAQGSFFPLQSYSKKTLRKNVPKSTRKYNRNVLMPPVHPIILLKSN